MFDGTSWRQITNKATGWTATSFGGGDHYIQSINQGADGTVTAVAVSFPTLATGTTDGTLKLGSKTDAKVAGWDTVKTDISHLQAVVSFSGEGDKTVTASTVTADTGTFTNLNVTGTASFTATTVSATTLTVGNVAVDNISATSASGNNAGIEVTVSTARGGVTGVGVAVTSATLLTSLSLTDFAGKTVLASATGIAEANSASDTKIPTEAAVRKAIDAKVASLDNAMHYIGTTSDAAIVQSATALPNDITGYTSSIRKSGDIVLKGTEEFIWNGTMWEKVGDQSAVTGGSSTATSNGFTVSVTNAAATAAPTVTFTAPEYSPAESSATGTSNDHTVTVTTKNGQVTGVVVAAPSRFALSEIPNASVSGADKGVSVSVTTSQGSVAGVVVGVKLQSKIATTNTDTEIPSAKAVSDALCWYKADGSTQWQ